MCRVIGNLSGHRLASEACIKCSFVRQTGSRPLCCGLSVAKMYCVASGHGDRFAQWPLPLGTDGHSEGEGARMPNSAQASTTNNLQSDSRHLCDACFPLCIIKDVMIHTH